LRYRLSSASREEDLPWNELLVLLEKRNRDRAEAGLPPEEATEKEVDEMLARLPGVGAVGVPRPVDLPEDREFRLVECAERRASQRRWGYPTEVYIGSPRLAEVSSAVLEDLASPAAVAAARLHGLVLNRSTGGLGIFADRGIPVGTIVSIRAVEAPFYVPAVEAEVRHCLRATGGYVLGCQFNKELPWSVRVWFG
jgi:hypothetical protein